jgi:hypothetical protein
MERLTRLPTGGSSRARQKLRGQPEQAHVSCESDATPSPGERQEIAISARADEAARSMRKNCTRGSAMTVVEALHGFGNDATEKKAIPR